MTYRKQFSFPQVLILNTDGVFFCFFLLVDCVTVLYMEWEALKIKLQAEHQLHYVSLRGR